MIHLESTRLDLPEHVFQSTLGVFVIFRAHRQLGRREPDTDAGRTLRSRFDLEGFVYHRPRSAEVSEQSHGLGRVTQDPLRLLSQAQCARRSQRFLFETDRPFMVTAEARELAKD